MNGIHAAGRMDSDLPKRKNGANNCPVFFRSQGKDMNATVKSYLYFLGFLAITKMVVKPIAVQMKLPVISDLI